jgi:hypothetical protein
MEIWMRHTDRGRVIESETRGGTPESQASMDDMMSNMESMLASLPVEAVGRGARWSVDRETARSGFAFVMHTESEVLDVTETSVRLRSTVEIRVPRQEMASAAGPVPVAGSGGGRGETTLDLTTMESSIVTDVDFSVITDPDGAQPSTTRITIGLSMRAR